MPNKNKYEQTKLHYYDQQQSNQVQSVTFDGYQITTNNPGTSLLLITVLICFALFIFGILFVPGSPLPIDKIIHWIKARWFASTTGREGGEGASYNTTRAARGKDEQMEQNEEGASSYYIREVEEDGTRSSSGSSSRSGTEKHGTRVESGKNQIMHSYALKDFDMDYSQVVAIRTGSRGKKKHTANSMRNLCVITAARRQGTPDKQMRPGKGPQNVTRELASTMIVQEELLPTKNVQRNHLKTALNPVVNSDEAAPLNNRLTFDDLLYHMTHFNSVSPNVTSYNHRNDEIDENRVNANTSSRSRRKSEVDISTLRNDARVILRWAAPWALQSIVSYGEDIATIVIISHFMGLRAMLCYSNVWFIVKLMHLVNDAWYSAIYKYVNIACAQETDEAYESAGRLISLGMIGNVILSIPFSTLTVHFMPDIMRLLGYEDTVVSLSQGYALIAILNRLISSTSDILGSILDLEGYAKFNAVFDFWTSLCDLAVVLIFVSWFRPSLLALGICHLILDILSTGIFYFLTIRRGCFDGYARGIFACTDISPLLSDLRVIGSATIPLAGQEIVENIEDIVFIIFAAYQGSAEVATWILICYLWEFVEILSESLSEAAAYKVSRHLARGKLELAQAVSFYIIKVGVLINVLCSLILYLCGPFFVWCLSLDDTLDQMLLEVIPYVVTCQPFIAVGMIVTEILNEALFVYKKATIVLTVTVTCVVIPLGAITTYAFHFNIEGLASAQCIGHTAAGVASVVLFMNADWNKALLKAQRNQNN